MFELTVAISIVFLIAGGKLCIWTVSNRNNELFDTDMKDYAEIYQHRGCRLYNKETADNSVTRYSMVYQKEPNL